MQGRQRHPGLDAQTLTPWQAVGVTNRRTAKNFLSRSQERWTIMSESLSTTAYPTIAGSICAAFPLLHPWPMAATGPGGAEPGGPRSDTAAAAAIATARMERASSGWG